MPAPTRQSAVSRGRDACGGGYAAAAGALAEGEAVARTCRLPPVCLARYSAASAATRLVSNDVPGSATATPMLTLGCRYPCGVLTTASRMRAAACAPAAVGPEQDADELVAADAGHDVVGAQRRVDRTAD